MKCATEKQIKYFRSLSSQYKRSYGVYGKQDNRQVGVFIENIERFIESGEMTSVDMSRAIEIVKRALNESV
ncbi:hypothetical protein [Paenibacillus woosongensis]|uniref:Uncharacterized protein n=1 Tax=Paenibacillus woosongensis TaxID=307580 RepID=A0ABQ4MYU1_9BACL|nr:hypothetical protein [Paenibacillus woosongensis]GIP61104.1 hypothetical protein J15TS10_49180 [Paenibacillus woosongensis]